MLVVLFLFNFINPLFDFISNKFAKTKYLGWEGYLMRFFSYYPSIIG